MKYRLVTQKKVGLARLDNSSAHTTRVWTALRVHELPRLGTDALFELAEHPFRNESQIPKSGAHLLSMNEYRVFHMSPNGDMSNRSAQAESFSLANMVPQVHANNAGICAGIEGAARQLALSEGEIYVISGPAFIGGNIGRIGNVLVPTHLWKVLYSPAQRRAGAYLITNDDTRGYSSVTVSDLEKMIGVNLLPGLSQKIRDNGMELPKPVSQRGGKKRKSQGSGQGQDEFTLRDFSRSIIDAINHASQH